MRHRKAKASTHVANCHVFTERSPLGSLNVDHSKLLLCPPGLSRLHCGGAAKFSILNAAEALVAVWHGVPWAPLQAANIHQEPSEAHGHEGPCQDCVMMYVTSWMCSQALHIGQLCTAQTYQSVRHTLEGVCSREVNSVHKVVACPWK